MRSLIGSKKSLGQLAALRGQQKTDTQWRLHRLVHNTEQLARCDLKEFRRRLVVVGCQNIRHMSDQKPLGEVIEHKRIQEASRP